MRAKILSALFFASAFAACSGSNPSSGQSGFLRIQGAQYIAGPLDTDAHADQPEIHLVNTMSNNAVPGGPAKSISGTSGPGSTAILMGLLGDTGHWVFPVQDVDQNTEGDYTFSCSAFFAANTVAQDGGVLPLILRATDRQGQIGPVKIQPMTLDEVSVPSGALVISLDWDTEADLDLHVQLPTDGDAGVNEIWSRKPTGLPPGTTEATVDAGMAAGYLDFDSNSQCAIDGRRVENVIFPMDAPSGQYRVRVDTFSLCGEVTARWRVRVFTPELDAPLVAYGQSTDTDTRFPHGQGAGVQALAFVKP